MNRAWLILACTACGPEARPTAAVPSVPLVAASVDAGTADAPVTAATVRARSRKTRVEAPHGGAITLLAVTPSGTAALTCDELGGVRLWPALDGTAEPRAVDLPAPKSFVIGPDPRGYVIAMTDAVGGLVIQVVDGDGLTIQRASLPVDPGFVGVAISEKGVIGWRADQRVLLISADGRVLGELATEAKQRIRGIAVAGARAAVVIETSGAVDSTHRARWLTLGPQLAWGAWIDAGTEVGSAIALSPSARRIAMLSRTGTAVQAIVIDTTTGVVLAHAPAPAANAIGLPTEDDLAVGTQAGGITWHTLSKAKPKLPRPVTGAHAPVDVPLLGVGGGRVISAVNGELVLASPTKTEFLGYELESPAVAAAAPGGHLLIGLGDSFALLDAKLVATAAPDFQIPVGSAIADLRHLAGDDWLIETSRAGDGVTAVDLVDTARKKSHSVRKGMSMVHMMLHDASTHLVTLSLGDTPEVLRYAPGKLRLDRIATLPKPTGFERAEIVPVDPALARGTQLVVVHMRDRLTVRWVKEPAALDKGTSVTVDGSLASVDAAGHVYIWRSDPHGMLELAVFRDGKGIGTLPTDGPTAVWPDRKGTQVVQVGQRSISVVALDGVRKWAQPLQGVTEAIWLDDGAIAIVSAAGIARLDAATGDVLSARCGWRFGLANKPHPVSPRVEPVCTQLN